MRFTFFVLNLPMDGVVNHNMSMRKQSANDINDRVIDASQDCDRKIAATTPKKRCVLAVPSKGMKCKTVSRITPPKRNDNMTYVGKRGKKNVSLSYTLRSNSKNNQVITIMYKWKHQT